VLPETEEEYNKVLGVFEWQEACSLQPEHLMIHLISSFILEHPGAVSPPDIQIFKAFLDMLVYTLLVELKLDQQWAQ
jgi:hypothetical protein